jgi:hypothetical protein
MTNRIQGPIAGSDQDIAAQVRQALLSILNGNESTMQERLSAASLLIACLQVVA